MAYIVLSASRITLYAVIMMVMLSHPMTSLPNIINVTLVTPNDVCMMGVTSPGGANCEAVRIEIVNTTSVDSKHDFSENQSR